MIKRKEFCVAREAAEIKHVATAHARHKNSIFCSAPPAITDVARSTIEVFSSNMIANLSLTTIRLLLAPACLLQGLVSRVAAYVYQVRRSI